MIKKENNRYNFTLQFSLESEIMINRIYLADAFGWDTETTAKVAIAQLREKKVIALKCPKAQLLRNESFRWKPNLLKILGYIPIINVIAGIIAIMNSEKNEVFCPNHTEKWKRRGVAMIVGGPLLLIVDLIAHVYHLSIADKYKKDHPDLIKAFDTGADHYHTQAWYPGYPVYCYGKP